MEMLFWYFTKTANSNCDWAEFTIKELTIFDVNLKKAS